MRMATTSTKSSKPDIAADSTATSNKQRRPRTTKAKVSPATYALCVTLVTEKINGVLGGSGASDDAEVETLFAARKELREAGKELREAGGTAAPTAPPTPPPGA